MTSIGIYWLFVEIFSYSTNGTTDNITKSFFFFSSAFSLMLFLSLFRNRPQNSFSHRLRGKDNVIEVKIGDAFDNDGSLVIPINDHFDVDLGGNVKRSMSLQAKLISDYYSGKSEHLATDISSKIDISQIYEIGKTVEVEQKDKLFFLLVNSKRKTNNRVESTFDDFLVSLSKLWTHIALEAGRNSTVSIPLISTNHGRITSLTKSTAIKEIIRSYIESSKHLSIADKLIICIHPNEIKIGNVDLDEIDEYLKFSCKHYRVTKISPKPLGKEVAPSSVEEIDY